MLRIVFRSIKQACDGCAPLFIRRTPTRLSLFTQSLPNTNLRFVFGFIHSRQLTQASL